MEINLRILEWIQFGRTPFWDGFFSLFTHLGDELVLIPIFCALFWCVNKRFAYHVSLAFFSGTLLSQLLKITFCIPRPWLLDPKIKPVESAVSGATGFSFPSGHTASAAGIYGGIAMNLRKWGAWLGLGMCTLLVAYSRLYLGVHTPLDVGVSLLISAVLLLLSRRVMAFAETHEKGGAVILTAGIALCAASLVYVHLRHWPFFSDIENFLDAYKAVGGGMGYFIGWYLERRSVNFDTKAPLWFQGVKLVCGLLLLAAIQQGLKTPLHALLGEPAGDFTRYLALVLFAVALYPMLFKWAGGKLKPQKSAKK